MFRNFPDRLVEKEKDAVDELPKLMLGAGDCRENIKLSSLDADNVGRAMLAKISNKMIFIVCSKKSSQERYAT